MFTVLLICTVVVALIFGARAAASKGEHDNGFRAFGRGMFSAFGTREGRTMICCLSFAWFAYQFFANGPEPHWAFEPMKRNNYRWTPPDAGQVSNGWYAFWSGVLAVIFSKFPSTGASSAASNH